MLIDLQEDYVSGGDLLRNQVSPMLEAFPDLPVNVAELLKDCREAKLPIVHIRGRDSAQNSKWLPWWNKIHGEGSGAGKAGPAEPWAAELPGEPVFIKHTYDAFLSDDVSVALIEYLKSNNITRLFLCGCLTKACVGFTANTAFTLGYEVYLIADCCGDRSKEDHDHYCSMYDGYHLKVVNRSDVLS